MWLIFASLSAALLPSSHEGAHAALKPRPQRTPVAHALVNAKRTATGPQRYVLAQYGNQFCGGDGNIVACQELYDDTWCHMTSPDHYVKMENNGDGTFTVRPGIDSDCSCYNGDVLDETYTPHQCVTSGGVGVTLLVGPDDDSYDGVQFAKRLESCPTNAVGDFAADVAGAGSCSLSFGLIHRGTHQRGKKRFPRSVSSAAVAAALLVQLALL
jgi:hypothetical protein